MEGRNNMSHFRINHSKANKYLQYVQSYRNEQGTPATRILANLGNITHMDESQIESLTCSFIKAMGMEKNFYKTNFEAGKGYHYGTALPVIAIWEELNIGEIIKRSLSEKVEIPVDRIALIQTANRYAEPESKLGCYRWYYNSLFTEMKNFVKFPEHKEEQLHTYYRSLDYLCESKEEIEKEIFYRLGSYGMNTSLILYDITSSYFEGEEAEIGKKGYSRDKRPDLDQIVIGVVLTGDGIPIAHHVFEGNRVDNTTVQEVVRDLRKRFGIEKAIFVGDKGMITVENIKEIKEQEYGYILGLQSRNRKVISYLIDKVMLNATEPIQEYGYMDLSEKIRKDYSEGIRFIACYNEKVAHSTRHTRDRNLRHFNKLQKDTITIGTLNSVKEACYKLKSFLARKHMTKLFKIKIEVTAYLQKSLFLTKIALNSITPILSISFDIFHLTDDRNLYNLNVIPMQEAIAYEEKLDGRYFIQTEGADLNKELIEESYKTLYKVERAFRVMKDDFDIQPIYVRKETRIRGHVMICYLALLVEALIEKKLKELFPDACVKNNTLVSQSTSTGQEPLTLNTLLEQLDTIRLISITYSSVDNKDNTTYISTKIGNNVKKLFHAMGIKNAQNPKKLSFQKQGHFNGQLLLNLGGEAMI